MMNSMTLFTRRKTTIINNDITDKSLGKKLNIFPEELGNRLLINNNELDPDNNLFADISWVSAYCAPAAMKSKSPPRLCFQ